MVSFILQLLVMFSLGTLIYLVAKTLPRINDTEPKELVFKEHWIVRKIESADKRIKTSSEKLLRRLGIILLKWENKINKKVTRLKEESAKDTSDILMIEDHPKEQIQKEALGQGPEEKKEEVTALPRKRPRKNDSKRTTAENENTAVS